MNRPRTIALAAALAAALAVPAAQAGYGYPTYPTTPPPAAPPATTYTLTVAKDGAGSGTVTSDPAGIACGADCSEAYASGTGVTLTAVPDTGSTFTGWSGACTGTGSCSVTMDAAKAVTASFAPAAAQGAEDDTAVAARLGAVNVARDARGRRVVRVTLAAEEQLRVELRLVRGSKTLAARTLAAFATGRRTATLVVPRAVAAGRARLEVAVADSAGNADSFARSVRVPKRP